ncbi:hypothetical protein AKJ16_DCAP01285 [Drosera capensis]
MLHFPGRNGVRSPIHRRPVRPVQGFCRRLADSQFSSAPPRGCLISRGVTSILPLLGFLHHLLHWLTRKHRCTNNNQRCLLMFDL